MKNHTIYTWIAIIFLLTMTLAYALSTTNVGNLAASGNATFSGSLVNVTGDLEIAGNITTVEEIFFEDDTTNHKIHDNATCVLVEGDTATLEVC